MSDACRAARATLARGPGEPISAADHVATCIACRQHAQDHERLLAALRAEPDPVDDVARARWLSRMSPELDAIDARRRARRRTVPVALAAAGAVAVAVAVWLVVGHRASPVVVALDREVLRPYVASGPFGESTATTLLAGRFSTIEVEVGQLVRASVVDPERRLAVAGPSRVTVTSATSRDIALNLTGTLLVDTRAPLSVRAGELTLRAQQATFAVQHSTAGTVVFVDRGEVDLADARLGPGDWHGPTQLRASRLVQQLREHASSAPPAAGSGILAIEGTGAAQTSRGIVLGDAPLWARVDAAETEIVIAAAAGERRVAIAIGDGVTRVAASRAPTASNEAIETAPPSLVRDAARGSDGSSSRDASSLATPSTLPRIATTTPSSTGTTTAAPTTPRITKTAPRIATTAPRTTTTAATPPSAAAHTITPSVATTVPTPRATSAPPSLVRDATRAAEGAGSANASSVAVAPTSTGAPVTADDLYARAEQALRAGDRDRAEQLWRELLASYPRASKAPHARYDLAQLIQRRDPRGARALLAELATPTAPAALREPAAYLACRLHVNARELDAATRCFTQFRSAHPDSPHDAEVLAWLAGRAEEAGGCAAARTLAAEYLTRYPKGAFAARAVRCAEAP